MARVGTYKASSPTDQGQVAFDPDAPIAVDPMQSDPLNDEVATGATAKQAGGQKSVGIITAAAPTTFDTFIIKAAPGRLYGYWFLNGDGLELAYVKFYDKATAPDPSADSALLIWEQFCTPLDTGVPGIKVIPFHFPHGLGFANGLSVAVTQDRGVGETPVDAGDLQGWITYF